MMISSSHPLSVVAMFHHYDEVVVVVVVALCRHRRRGDDVASGCVCTPWTRSDSRGYTHTPQRRNTIAHATQRGVDVAHRA